MSSLMINLLIFHLALPGIKNILKSDGSIIDVYRRFDYSFYTMTFILNSYELFNQKLQEVDRKFNTISSQIFPVPFCRFVQAENKIMGRVIAKQFLGLRNIRKRMGNISVSELTVNNFNIGNSRVKLT